MYSWVIGFVGRVIFDLEKQKEMEFTWGLRDATNNEVEALAVLHGLVVFKDKVVRKDTMIGDLLVILWSLQFQILLKNLKISRLCQKTLSVINAFEKIELFFISRSKKLEVDKLVNVEACSQEGFLMSNEGQLTIVPTSPYHDV